MADVQGCGRFEWERIIRRARFDAVIPKSGTRGAISGTTFKAVALTWASFADTDGTNIFASWANLAVSAESSYRTVKTVMGKLIKLGLTERTQSGARRLHKTDTYRLCFPENLLDVVEVLDPAQFDKAMNAVLEANRGKRRAGSTGHRTSDSVQGPPDTAQASESAWAESRAGSTGPAQLGCAGSTGPVVQGPPDSGTYQDGGVLKTAQTSDLRTAVTGPRASDAAPNPEEIISTKVNGNRIRPYGPTDRATQTITEAQERMAARRAAFAAAQSSTEENR